jgi:hypothetical protein
MFESLKHEYEDANVSKLMLVGFEFFQRFNSPLSSNKSSILFALSSSLIVLCTLPWCRKFMSQFLESMVLNYGKLRLN